MSTQKFIAKNSLIVAFLFCVGAVLGIFRESSIAYIFGATDTTDAYLAALIIPTLFSGVISNSLLNTVIPLYSNYLVRGEVEEANNLINLIITIIMIILSGLMAILFFIIPFLVYLIAPTYQGDQLKITIDLTKILMPTILFQALVGVLIGVNNSNYSFIATSSIRSVSNIITILSIFILCGRMGIYGLAMATMVGSLAELLIQVPTTLKNGIRYKINLDLHHPELKKIAKLMIPVVLLAIIPQLSIIIERVLAIRLSVGAVSALYFANKLVLLPQSIITAAVGTVIFPFLAKAASEQDWSRLMDGFNKSVRLLFILLLPAAIGIWVLRIPLVELVYQHGAFTSNETIIISSTMPYYLGTLIFGSIASTISYIYYSMKRVTSITIIGFIAVGGNLGFSLLFINTLQQYGLALANSLSALLNLTLLTFGVFYILELDKKVVFNYKSVSLFLCKILLSAILMGVLLGLTYNLICFDIQFLRLIVTLSIGIIFYLIVIYILKVEELLSCVNWLRCKYLGGLPL